MRAPEEVKNAAAVSQNLHHPAEQLWNLIIRPPRSRYSTEQLGPTHFLTGSRTFVRRTDVELRNPRGHALQCSFFEPLPMALWDASRRAGVAEAVAATSSTDEAQPEPLPCIIFLHGNSSCRLEAIPLVPQLMPLGIALFCFDFSGCGLSEGQYISLGWFERDDLAACIEHLRASGRVSRIALWGRSMGAFTALLHADRDPTIAGLVLDSPFTSLNVLAEELARSYAKVPGWMVRAVLVLVRSIIRGKADFDIEQLDALEHVGHSFQPALFIAARGDDFIPPHHAKKLHEAYQGEKELYMISGDHNSMRPDFCRKKAILFLCGAFHCPRLDQLLEMHTSGLYDIFAGHQQNLSKPTAAGEDVGGGGADEGAAICQQMSVFPALRMMLLVRQRQCRRPFSAKTTIKLLEAESEAGIFVRLEPSSGAEARGLPRFLVLTVSASALIASRICDDALETVAVGAGLAPREAQQLELNIDRGGGLSLRLGEDPALHVDCGASFREEVTLWLMLLHGQTAFGTLAVDDSEATLRESLGDAMLWERHLGGGALATSDPAPLPRGDSGRIGQLATWLTPPPAPADGAAARDVLEGRGGRFENLGGIQDDYNALGLAEEVHDIRIDALEACVQSPEALIGWRLRVQTIGEGVVVGIRRRWGRSTQHLIAGVGDSQGGSLLDTRRGKPHAVVLCRKEAQACRRKGLSFDLLWKEF